MSIQHQQLAQGAWQKLLFCEQMANIGSEVIRANKWKIKSRNDYAIMAADRAFELIDLTIESQDKSARLKELTRLRETVADYFYGDNEYSSNTKNWENYFIPFTYLSRKGR